MANSDKNILITPNTGSSTLNPTIAFTGSDNVPITLRVLDTATISFEGSAGQLFSIINSLTGTIFSVNDISGMPSIEVLDTGIINLNGTVLVNGKDNEIMAIMGAY
jgi:tRNA(His) 5'-end guanylyltransferase